MAVPPAPPTRVSGQSSSAATKVSRPSTAKEAFDKAQIYCVIEYKASEAFKGELLDASTIGFVQGYKNCKVRIKHLMPQLDLHRLRPRNSDEEIGTFSADKD